MTSKDIRDQLEESVPDYIEKAEAHSMCPSGEPA